MNSLDPFDAVIIGGSLGGSAAGILLSEAGWKVLILERSEFPRDKVCGEFLSPGVWPLLDRLGLSEKVKSLGGQEIDSVGFAWPKRKEIEVRLPSISTSHPYACGLSRKALDHLLLMEAVHRGCSVLQNEEVSGISHENGYLEVSTLRGRGKLDQRRAYQASIVINAAGQYSPLFLKRGAMRTPPLKKGDKGGFSEHVKSPLAPLCKGGTKSSRIGFKAHFQGLKIDGATKIFFFRGGYLGIIQVEGGMANLCGTVDAALAKRHRGNWDGLLAEASEQNQFLGEWLNGASRTEPWLSCGGLTQEFKGGYSRGMFHVGDAACFLEPFLGQGMTMAFASALLLSLFLREAGPHGRDVGTTGKRYEEELKALYRSRLRIGRFLNWFVGLNDQSFLRLPIVSTLPVLLKQIVNTPGTGTAGTVS